MLWSSVPAGRALQGDYGAVPKQGLRTACVSKVFPTRSSYRCRPGRYFGLPWQYERRIDWQLAYV